jgi:hypothetical protein
VIRNSQRSGLICVTARALEFRYGKLRRFQLAGMALIWLEDRNKSRRRACLRELISTAGVDVTEKARRERLLRHPGIFDKVHPLDLARYSLE